ncbi:MAG: flavodoxin [Muribaculaceae bacterium]|nr:flavodoxin [Muribaculaceae bacterium]
MKLTKILTLALLALAFTAACAGKKDSKSEAVEAQAADTPAAIVYFSATGNTRAQAQRLGKRLGLPVHEIVPAEVYTEADLDWRDENSRSSRESADSTLRPPMADTIPGLDGVKTVFLGYPVWWNRYPNIIATFMERHKKQLEGKRIVPFATSGSSTINNSVKTMGLHFPFVTVGNGLLMNDVSDAQIDEWAQPYL